MKYNQPSALCLILTGAIFSSSLISCSTAAKDSEQESFASSDEMQTTEAISDAVLTDAVPTLDFEGTSFRTIEQGGNSNYGFYAESENGDLVNDAIFRRISYAEERLNIHVEPTEAANLEEISKKISSSVMADTDDYELVFNQFFTSGADAAKGMMYDWNQIPYVDFSHPWYTQSIRDCAIGDCLYLIESDLSDSYMLQTWFIIFNKDIAENHDLGDFYEVVQDGKWTIDYLNTVSSSVYEDLNGSGKQDEGDLFGLGTGNNAGCMIAAMLYGANASMIKLTEDQTDIIHTIKEEHAVDALSKISELLSPHPSKIIFPSYGYKYRIPNFTKGNILFMPAQIGDLLLESTRSFKNNFGVLPMPKFDEAQTSYYTTVDGGADIITVPASAKNINMIGAVTEIMSAYSYNEVIPTYMEIALAQKGTRDEESITMLRMILDSRLIDFGYLYDSFSGWTMKLPDIIKDPTSIISQLEKQEKIVTRHYEKLLKFLEKSE